jgi:signal recognition particle protein
MAFETLSDRLNQTFRKITGKANLSEKNMEDILQDIRKALLEADVNYRVVRDFLAQVQEKAIGHDVIKSVDPAQMVVKIVYDELVALLGTDEAGISFNPSGITTIMVAGLQGTGKTTNLAKIAKVLKYKQGCNPLIIAADIIRPAAIEQLKTLGKEIEVEVYSEGSEVAALKTVENGMKYAKEQGFDTVLIDTAGRLHIDDELMSELKQMKDIVHPQEILLTVDAMTGQDIITVAQAFNELLNITGLVVTKLDGDARGGAVLSVRAITTVPIKYTGVGEKIDDLDVFYPDRMANRILGMGDVVTLVEQAQEKLDMEAAERSAQRLMEGKFSLDDMLVQLQQLAKMGPLKSVLKMLPGMGDMLKEFDGDAAEVQLKISKAIIQSMTVEEREKPDIVRASRRGRIAAGSGTSDKEVTRLITQFNKMKEQMRMMSKMFKGGNPPFGM